MKQLRCLHKLLGDPVAMLSRDLPPLNADVHLLALYVIEGVKQGEPPHGLPWEVVRSIEEDAYVPIPSVYLQTSFIRELVKVRQWIHRILRGHLERYGVPLS